MIVDVYETLDISNSRQAVSRLNEDEENTVTLNYGTISNTMKAIINESDLYMLVLSSRKPETKQYK